MVYSVKEAAQQLGIGRTLLYKLIQSGRLDVVKVGRRTLITKASVQKLIEEGQSGN